MTVLALPRRHHAGPHLEVDLAAVAANVELLARRATGELMAVVKADGFGHGAADVEPIAKMLAELLEREGLNRLAPAGDPFDPNLHDAVMHEPGEGGEAVVVETLRTGYEWKGRVLRPAMVKVRG